MSKNDSRHTRAVRAGIETDSQHGAVMPPVYLSSNFAFEGFDRPRVYDYTRTRNPTRDALADVLAELEGGAGATVTGSGMGAITLACQLLDPGDLVVGPWDCYGGTFRLFDRLSDRGLFRVKLVDQTDPDVVAAAMDDGVKMLWVESPTNPLLRVGDLQRLGELAKASGALFVVDNTFLSPALQRPTLRGIRTLFARMQQHEKNGNTLAEVIDGHEAVSRVYYPGLPTHPGHELASRQQRGFGGMISFDLKGGRAAARAFLEAVELFSLAESLGGVESLACHPATMTHAPLDAASREAAGISDGLVRLSAGIEATEDLVRDVLQGLDAAARAV
jgi:cystathionine gamma-synthase